MNKVLLRSFNSDANTLIFICSSVVVSFFFLAFSTLYTVTFTGTLFALMRSEGTLDNSYLCEN